MEADGDGLGDQVVAIDGVGGFVAAAGTRCLH
jgi:hypothetical protein